MGKYIVNGVLVDSWGKPIEENKGKSDAGKTEVKKETSAFPKDFPHLDFIGDQATFEEIKEMSVDDLTDLDNIGKGRAEDIFKFVNK